MESNNKYSRGKIYRLIIFELKMRKVIEIV